MSLLLEMETLCRYLAQEEESSAWSEHLPHLPNLADELYQSQQTLLEKINGDKRWGVVLFMALLLGTLAAGAVTRRKIAARAERLQDRD